MSDSHIRIAKIAGAHGLKGRLKVVLISDIAERFSPGNQVYIQKESLYAAYIIREFQSVGGKTALLFLEGIEDRDAALAMRGSEVFITREEAERTRNLLDGDSFYYYDIIGCEVYRDGRPFGRVTNIIPGGAGELLVILDSDGLEHLVPFVSAMVDTKEIKSGRIDIDPAKGLLD
ncbi:MAG TPA: ribosome maturation factor RimM [Spirochaetota bacterium]|nr:ribosome maturation factor RimM [Spirochaetota bacterium]